MRSAHPKEAVMGGMEVHIVMLCVVNKPMVEKFAVHPPISGEAI